MAFDQTKLNTLRQQMAQKQRLTHVLEELQHQEARLIQQIEPLKKAMATEQAQVDTLERKSLSSVFYQMIGKLEEKLDKERAEAYAARIKYDTAFQSLQAVTQDLQRCQASLAALDGCEDTYAAVLAEKLALLKDAGIPETAQVRNLEESLTAIAARQTELQEAIAAGNEALRCAEAVISSLDSADSWATFDLFGGGLFADIAKHEHLDTAQEQVNTLEEQLLHFKSELADVSLDISIHVSMGDFMKFADFFFDGLFADISASEHITNALGEAEAARDQIEEVLDKLDTMQEDASTQHAAINQQLEDLVVRAAL